MYLEYFYYLIRIVRQEGEYMEMEADWGCKEKVLRGCEVVVALKLIVQKTKKAVSYFPVG